MTDLKYLRGKIVRLSFLALALGLALVVGISAHPAAAQCTQAVAAGETAVSYAQRAYGYLYLNESYVERLYQLMLNASYATNYTCAQVTSNLSRLADYGPRMLAQARASFYAMIGAVSASVAALGASAWACVRYCRRIAWRAWVLSHRRWVVERTGVGSAPSGPPGGADPDRYPVYAAGLFIVLAVGLAGVTAFELYWRPGPFSVIALLNSQGLIGDYPALVLASSNVTLMVLVINHMNNVMLYRVSIAVVNSSAPPDPSSLARAQESFDLYIVVPPGQNATAPLRFMAPSTPGQYKLLLLLYYYNSTTGLFNYSGLFNQLYFNVTPR